MTSDRRWHLPSAPEPVPPAAPWLERVRAHLVDADGLPLAQAATVAADGVPEVRTVVVRAMSRDGNVVFTGDDRSAKAEAIRAGSGVELCLWLAEPGVQIRLRGRATIVSADAGPWAETRRALWDELRDAERRGVVGPAPGTPLDLSAPRPPAPEHAVPAFAVFWVSPRRVEVLVLGDPHQREIWRWWGEAWTGGPVAP